MMKDRIKGAGFILIILGTLGLLLNEFVFEGSTAVTLIAAAFDVIGLACLVIGQYVVKEAT
jgi:hypothetical protein